MNLLLLPHATFVACAGAGLDADNEETKGVRSPERRGTCAQKTRYRDCVKVEEKMTQFSSDQEHQEHVRQRSNITSSLAQNSVMLSIDQGHISVIFYWLSWNF